MADARDSFWILFGRHQDQDTLYEETIIAPDWFPMPSSTPSSRYHYLDEDLPVYSPDPLVEEAGLLRNRDGSSSRRQFAGDPASESPIRTPGTGDSTTPVMPLTSTSFLQNYTLDDTMSERSFLEWYPKGDATLTFPNDVHDLESIHGLNLSLIQGRSAILAAAFEESRSGPRLYLETLTSATALPFLRFLYTGTYALAGPAGDFFEDVPSSVLLHSKLYYLGDMYDLNALKTQAYVNVMRQCEFGCSSPDKPIELCAAIRYIYQHLSTHKQLINTIIDYCVGCFLRHGLGQDPEFRQLAYELRPFHQALCMNSRERGFENDAAGDIIRLPFKPHVPETYASRDDTLAIRFDDVFHFHDDLEISQKKRKRPDSQLETCTEQTTLPLRVINRTDSETYGEELGCSGIYQKTASKRRASSIVDWPLQVPTSAAGRSEMTLALRNAADLSFTAAIESESEEELPKIRRSELPHEVDLSSDTGFELVRGPSIRDVLSDDESDSSSVVEVNREDAEPSRSQSRTSSARLVDTCISDNESDSDWQIL